MIGIADSRFQAGLLAEAKAAGKIEPGYEIPESQRDNTPEGLRRKLGYARASGLLPAYPFGSDLDPDEQALAGALERLKNMTATPGLRAQAIFKAMSLASPSPDEQRKLARVGLEKPAKLQDQILRRLLCLALRADPDA